MNFETKECNAAAASHVDAHAGPGPDRRSGRVAKRSSSSSTFGKSSDPNEDVLASYTPLVECGHAHPSSLCTTSVCQFASGAKLATEEVDRLIHQDLKDGRLSDAQLTMVALARMRFENGLGLLAADGTGVGKVRQGVAVALNERLLPVEETWDLRSSFLTSNSVSKAARVDIILSLSAIID